MSDPKPEGLDVSRHQGVVNWTAVKAAGKSFVAIKATEGIDYAYADYYTDAISPARNAGMIAGGYHYFIGHESGAEQAKYFLQIAQLQAGDLLPMLDLEDTGDVPNTQFAEEALTWLNIVERALGKKPFVYTRASFFEEIGNPAGFEDYPLWIAQYETDKPTLPAGWTLYTVWQHSQTGEVNGVDGAVDLDHFNGSFETLDIFRMG